MNIFIGDESKWVLDRELFVKYEKCGGFHQDGDQWCWWSFIGGEFDYGNCDREEFCIKNIRKGLVS